MRLPKARREQLAGQYLIATLCAWDVEQRWDLDPALAAAWDLGRFDDPYRRVLLPKYPPTREGVCTALAVQFGTQMEDLAAHIATGKVYAASAKPWDVAVDSLQKLTALVRQAGYGTRIWRVAEGRLDLHQAYRESMTDRDNRSAAQREAKKTLWSLAGNLHADDVAIWLTTHWHFAIPNMPPIAHERAVPLSRYRLLRELFDGLIRHEGADEAQAFLAYLANTHAADRVQQSRDTHGWGEAWPRATTTPDCFRALGLPWPCTEVQIKHAYRTLAFAAHPDQGGSAEAFQGLAEAYEAALKWLERAEQAR